MKAFDEEQPGQGSGDPRPVPSRLHAEVIRSRLEERLFERVPKPLEVARFALIEHAGTGGMGIVYRAFDPELQRDIALKLLRPGQGGSEDARRRAMDRLLREARAAARVSHPNVVTVHEVGLADDGLYIAMEYVDGMTLDAWGSVEKRDWTEVVDHFVEAGRGLAAAHAAGIVHRDFKPQNVLVGADGRPKVADFGLAQASATAKTEIETTYHGVRVVDSTQDVTETGTILGTRAYMSPEQLHGERATALSDQFSFCVALWEALWGMRPYDSDDVVQLRESLLHGRRQSPGDLRGVHAKLHAVLERGLSPIPSDRFPDMEALLDALLAIRSPPSRTRGFRRWAVAGVAAMAMSAAGLTYFLTTINSDPAQSVCEQPVTSLDARWDDARRTKIREGFAATNLSFAEDSADRTLGILDAYAEAFRAQHRDTCRATWERGEQSEPLLDARMACLHRRLEAFDALARQLEKADDELVAGSIFAAASLPPLQACAELTLTEGPPPPGDAPTREAVARVDDMLAQARGHELAGRYEDALSVAEMALSDAEPLDHAPALAKAHNMVARLRHALHRDPDPHLELAYLAAIRGQDDEQAALAAIARMPVLDQDPSRREEALAWSERAAAYVERLGGDDRLEAHRLEALGDIVLNRGDAKHALPVYERALEHAAAGEVSALERAALRMQLAKAQLTAADYEAAGRNLDLVLEVYRRELGEGHPRLADVMGAQGTLAARGHDFETAHAHFVRATELLDAALGEHPRTAGAHANRGSAARSLGRFDEAQTQMERALDMLERTVGPEDRRVAGLLSNLGNLAASQGDLDQAQSHFERSLAMQDNPFRAHAIEGLAGVFQARGDYDDALALLRGARDDRWALGQKDLAIQSRMHIASVLLDAGRWRESIAQHETALAEMDETNQPDHVNRPDAHFGIGEARVQLREFGHAIAPLETAIAAWSKPGAERPVQRAKAELRLAQALWATKADRTRALELARSAAATFEAQNADPSVLAEARAWLGTHARAP